MGDKNSLHTETEHQDRNCHRTQMDRKIIVERLKEKGFRITKQRSIILDIILENEFPCCKEIYYRAVKIDSKIGRATVYRMINALEEIGAICRKNIYNVNCSKNCEIAVPDNVINNLSRDKWNKVIQAGLKACGYVCKEDG